MSTRSWDAEADYLQAVAEAEQRAARQDAAEQRRLAQARAQSRTYADSRAWWEEQRTRRIVATVADLSARLDRLDPPPEPEAVPPATAGVAEPDTGEPSGPSITRQPGGAAWLVNRWRSQGWRA